MAAAPALLAATEPVEDLAAARRLFAPIGWAATEMVAFAYLSPTRALLGMRVERSGMREAVAIPIRAVAADALRFDAAAVVMAHNHPSGIAWPSEDDLHATRRLARTLDAIGIKLCDHLVLAGDRCASLRGLGLL